MQARHGQDSKKEESSSEREMFPSQQRSILGVCLCRIERGRAKEGSTENRAARAVEAMLIKNGTAQQKIHCHFDTNTCSKCSSLHRFLSCTYYVALDEVKSASNVSMHRLFKMIAVHLQTSCLKI